MQGVGSATAYRSKPQLLSATRWQTFALTALPFVVVGAVWEIVAHLNLFPARPYPSLETIATAIARLTVSGALPPHAADTVLRLGSGFALAAAVGVGLGIVMGRWRLVEDLSLPLVSMGAPIPGIAYAPLFLLWFGLGNVSTILLVGFVSVFPIIFNTWTGVKAVKEIWVRSALAICADDRGLFQTVILHGALPHILTGPPLALA